MKLVYISSPDNAEPAGDQDKVKLDALKACEEAYHLGRLSGEHIVPITLM